MDKFCTQDDLLKETVSVLGKEKGYTVKYRDQLDLSFMQTVYKF